MTAIFRTFFLVSIAAALLASNFAVARSLWSREVFPPSKGGEFLPSSSFHRPWYGGKRREFDSEEKSWRRLEKYFDQQREKDLNES
ncbi:hypothetical protein AWC38_SpisGene7953 [Stylophora pistillata]|uniref:Uncharacterized protein n=1 Tax=Stylophora pistillata TaxID=50429 RepID=A0A2B4SFJ8_STYPI|nr:hypothetical protein AWC38_SpisGene7953 [Stylophora pistillata]